jgi:hypothetical protein
LSQDGLKEISMKMYQLLAGVTLLLLAAFGTSPMVRAQGESGELWVTSQGTDRLFIVHGQGSWIETVPVPGIGPHITTFSPLGDYAYVSGMRNGDLSMLRADDRQVVQTLHLGSTLTHQAKPSPDGSLLLVAQIASMSLIKVAADEAAESWQVIGSLSFASLGRAPICSVFRDDGERAYVSLRPSGIAIVDVPTMTHIGTLTTDGLVGAADWHSFNMSPNEKVGFGTSPHSDEIILADLAGAVASPIAALQLDPTPGAGNDEPDALSVRGNTLFVSLRALVSSRS